MQPLQTLLHEIVDYAGLFPPAGLSMPEMLGNYARYLESDNRWMLGRVVVPLARLGEFASEWNQLNAGEHVTTRISLLPPPLDSGEFGAAVESINAFNAREKSHTIDAVEVRVTDPGAVANAAQLSESIQCFVEVPLDNRDEIISSIAGVALPKRVFAKIRTGGVKAEMIPKATSVAEFIVACRNAGIGMKATAGLHHPFRAEYPLTYEPGCSVGRMHGFLNVFIGACLVYACDLQAGVLSEFLEHAEPADLNVTPESVSWRDYKLSSRDIAQTREAFAVSFGSCSFIEPIEDLTQLALMPESPNAPN